MAILIVVRPQVDPLGAGRLVLRCQRHQVAEVTAITYQLGERYGHILPLPKIFLYSLNKMCRNLTSNFKFSRSGILLLDGNINGYDVANHIATKVEVNPWMLSTLKNAKSI